MKIKKAIGFVFASALLFGGLTTLSFVKQSSEIIVEEVEAWSDKVTPNVDTTYYSTCDDKTGSLLKSALAAFNKPKNPSYDWSRYEAADEAQDDETSILCLYTRHNIKKDSHCGNYSWDKWNREHVFPQGNFPKSDKDNHNIFACEGQINNYRGNLEFAEGGDRVSVFGHVTDCYKTKTSFEPCDDAKGEVARACMYCTIYYGYDLTDIFDSINTAMKWHSQHPVTPREIYRNNVVFGLQGNRNPFIDHPSYANTLWNSTYTYTASDPVDGGEPAPTVAVTGVTLNKNSLTLEEGKSETLTATVAPSNATNKSVTWSTGNSSIATVNNGAVTAKGEGQTTITVKTNDGNFTATCSVTVTAKPTPEPQTYTISFNANGGGGTMDPVTKQEGFGYTLPQNGFTAPTGKEFSGWKINNSGSLLQPGDNISINSNITLYAQWKDIPVPVPVDEVEYEITFNANGGSGTMSGERVDDDSYVLPQNKFIAPSGKVFEGWKIDNEGSILQPGATITLTKDIVLYAQWKENVTPEPGPEPEPTYEDAKLISLEITPPKKVEYNVGEELDLTGFVAMAKYDDQSTKDVTDKVEMDSVNMKTAGNKTIIVSYTEGNVTVRGRIDIKISEGSSSGAALGCHGSIIASSAIISITSLIGLGLLLYKKKHE